MIKCLSRTPEDEVYHISMFPSDNKFLCIRDRRYVAMLCTEPGQSTFASRTQGPRQELPAFVIVEIRNVFMRRDRLARLMSPAESFE
jgi:hypothetical protein